MKRIVLVMMAMLVMLTSVAAQASSVPKKWTFMVFLNGNNNLDSFGKRNVLAMEKVGSNDEVNIVVQWASYRKKHAVRMLVQKSNNPSKVTSPVVQDLGLVDMGDYRNLEDFVDWTVKNYPADHYFIAVWNHGNGWKMRKAGNMSRDISYDDLSGNHITTEQLGYAMAHAAHTIGHKVDIYASDACLMGMAEVANEMSDYVQYFAGSQDLEPGDGWPYQAFLTDWINQKDASAEFVLTSLTNRYVEFYDGMTGITFSAYDLSKLPLLNQAVRNLSAEVQNLSAKQQSEFRLAAREALYFTYPDYVDLFDLMDELSSNGSLMLNHAVLGDVRAAIAEFVIANRASEDSKKAHGLSVWLPLTKYSFKGHADRYTGLRFSRQTNWIDALAVLNK